MPRESDVSAITNYVRQVLSLQPARLPEEYFYQSLPLCVLDAVFSIGVRYGSTQRVVTRYCEYTKQPRIRSSIEPVPRTEQESISSFHARSVRIGADLMATEIYLNRQRTSPRGGVLKAEASMRFAEVLGAFGVEHFQDVVSVADDPVFEAAIRAIPGQRSGISLSYFWMLAGSDDFIKPDRMIIRFLEAALGRVVAVNEAPGLLADTVWQLLPDFPDITLRLLDHEIWSYQRTVPSEARAHPGPASRARHRAPPASAH